MKKFLVEITDDAHFELVKMQSERKVNRQPRSNIRDIASDVLEESLMKNKKPEK